MASGRICKACGRRLNLDEHNDAGKHWRVVKRGRGRLQMQRVQAYACKLRLVATSPVTGKTLTPDSPQRLKSIDNRWVHEDRFAPGKDLNPDG